MLNGTLLGFAVGFGGTALWGSLPKTLSYSWQCHCPSEGSVRSLGPSSMASARREIYAKSRTTVSVAPVIQRHRQAVVFTLSR
jgi:hypothetical protein